MKAKGNIIKTILKLIPIVMVIFTLPVVFGCAGTQGVKYSGFLGDYSQFKPGKEGVAQVYIKKGVDFKKYKKLMPDHVVFYLKEDAQYKGIQADEMKELADEFHKAFIKAFGDAYPVTDTPGPDVLRIRVAITDIEPNKPGLSAISTVTPVGLAVSTIKKGVTGKHTGVGSTSMEAELLDSLTNERLAAAVDSRTGGKLEGMSKWGSAKEAFEFWSKRLRVFLDETHGIKK